MLSMAKPVEYNPDKEPPTQYKNKISDIADEYAQMSKILSRKIGLP